MPDLKSVIRGLEICSAGDVNSNRRACTDCPFYPAGYTGCSAKRLLSAALEIMKAQEPRVLTLEEVINYDGPVYITWHDPESGCWAICPPIVEAMARTRPEWDVMHFDGGAANQLKAYYGRTWRAWTAKPTEEKRKAEPWPC